MTPPRPPEGGARGWIIPIGGGEEKVHNPVILERFVEICGGRGAKLVVIPTASRLEDTGTRYASVFRDLGVDEIEVMDFDTRRDADERGRSAILRDADGVFLTGGNQMRLATGIGGTNVARALRDLGADEVEVMDFDTRRDADERGRSAILRDADGVFLTGGNQMRLATGIGGTNVARALRELNARGGHVAGTSAGASFLSEHMIAFGDDNRRPQAGSVTLAPGLGLTNRVVIDQHFTQRGRLGRLLTALAFNPFLIGLGLDEDTAAFIGPDKTVEVVGSGTLTVVDASGLTFSSMDQANARDPVSMLGVVLHVLIQGATFNLHTREASSGSLALGKR